MRFTFTAVPHSPRPWTLPPVGVSRPRKPVFDNGRAQTAVCPGRGELHLARPTATQTPPGGSLEPKGRDCLLPRQAGPGDPWGALSQGEAGGAGEHGKVLEEIMAESFPNAINTLKVMEIRNHLTPTRLEFSEGQKEVAGLGFNEREAMKGL